MQNGLQYRIPAALVFLHSPNSHPDTPFQVIPMDITDDNLVQVPIYTEELLETGHFSCCLCSDLSQPPLGSWLARPASWPSGQCPNSWTWSWDRDSRQRQYTRWGIRAARHSPLGKIWVPEQTEARGPGAEPRPGCESQELRAGQEPVLGQGGRRSVSADPSGWCLLVAGYTSSASWQVPCSAPSQHDSHSLGFSVTASWERLLLAGSMRKATISPVPRPLPRGADHRMSFHFRPDHPP